MSHFLIDMLKVVMLRVFMLSVVMSSVIMLSVAMLSVVVLSIVASFDDLKENGATTAGRMTMCQKQYNRTLSVHVLLPEMTTELAPES